ncbi:hypothetical protein OHA21_08210 [Actinoplanes sp. NBC_00393]|uniref:hypothetical protein n=1 Tax=Actinoplanes sp. NBC_00393 TaxID=2975953 RepID=UPI002E1C65B4
MSIYGVLVTAILGLGALFFNINKLRRDDFERVQSLHADLTTGPVAEARHVAGSAFEDKARGHVVELTTEEIKSLFIVLWCFERIDAARSSMVGRWRFIPRLYNPRQALDDSVRNHVRIYNGYVAERLPHDSGAFTALTARDRALGLRHLADELGVGTDHIAVPVTGGVSAG